MTTDPNDNRICAYEVVEPTEMPITPGPVARAWMDVMPERAPYRCLPMTIANQAGWMIACPLGFSAVWDGEMSPPSLHIEFDHASAQAAEVFGGTFVAAPLAHVGGRPELRVSNHFGNGILTFSIPYLFRTPRGVNLWVKGPSNYFKDGVHPLEGIVETDWSPATFTMNWKLTRPMHRVRFERGEPICMVVPLVRGLAEALEPIRMPLQANPELQREYQAWSASRWKFLADLVRGEEAAAKQGWQRDYLQGVSATGEPAPEHQTRLELREFKKVSGQ